MAEVLQLTSLWSGRLCVDVDVIAIDDAPLDKMAAALRAETFSMTFCTALGQQVGPASLAEWLRGALDTRYAVRVLDDRLRVDWDLRSAAPTPPVG